MPRKTPCPLLCRSPPAGFNEAAARCRGKLAYLRFRPAVVVLASMRPRPDAAENEVHTVTVEATDGAASMRPRPDAAENAPGLIPRTPRDTASMRPRPDAAENVGWETSTAPR